MGSVVAEVIAIELAGALCGEDLGQVDGAVLVELCFLRPKLA